MYDKNIILRNVLMYLRKGTHVRAHASRFYSCKFILDPQFDTFIRYNHDT